MTQGTVFSLAPRDEETLPRSINGETALGSYFHGMVTAIPSNSVSAGVVLRHVVNTRDVNVQTNFVIMTQQERLRFQESKAWKVEKVREHWKLRSAEYAQAVAPLLVEAFHHGWGVDASVLAPLQTSNGGAVVGGGV